MITFVTLARALAAAFEHRTRDNGEPYCALRDGSPEWMADMVYAAHGGMMPNDWRYRAIANAAAAMGELLEDDSDAYSVPPDAYTEPDPYTSDRIAWLGSHIARPGYCDEAAAEYGNPTADIIERIGYGQSYDLAEVWSLLAAFLADEANCRSEGEEPRP